MSLRQGPVLALESLAYVAPGHNAVIVFAVHYHAHTDTLKPGLADSSLAKALGVSQRRQQDRKQHGNDGYHYQ
jgi:hypothetical protein